MSIQDLFEKKAKEGDGAFAIAFALLELANAQTATSASLQRLGNGNASTQFGAIEALGMQLGEKLVLAAETIAGAIELNVPD